jgi:hypothetical protein
MKENSGYPNFRIIFAFVLFCPVVASLLFLVILYFYGAVQAVLIGKFASLFDNFDSVVVLVLLYLSAVGAVVTQGVQGLLLSLIFVGRKTRRGLMAYLTACAWMSASPIFAFLLIRQFNHSALLLIAACLFVSSLITIRLFVPRDMSQSENGA